MTTTRHPLTAGQSKVPAPSPGRRSIDPILQEVYDIKAKLNAEAGYSVQKILERARQNAARLTAEH